jgi:hypothetical protein
MNDAPIDVLDFLKLDLAPRPRRTIRQIAIAEDKVKVRGQALSAIWWRGRQWAVTAYGIECLDGTYVIERERLLELPHGSWPEHMAGKIWVDIDEFATAWLIALLLHGYKTKRKDLLDAFGRLPPRRRPVRRFPAAVTNA